MEPGAFLAISAVVTAALAFVGSGITAYLTWRGKTGENANQIVQAATTHTATLSKELSDLRRERDDLHREISELRQSSKAESAALRERYRELKTDHDRVMSVLVPALRLLEDQLRQLNVTPVIDITPYLPENNPASQR